MKGNLRNSIVVLLFALLTFNGRAQNPCQDSLNRISQAYNDGEWSSCKNASLSFIKNSQALDRRFLSKAPLWHKYSSNCQNSIPKVYYYLIKSCIRLYELDNAILYYRESLIKELNIDFDSTDNQLMNNFGTLKKNSFGLYAGSVSTDFKNYRIYNEFKIGALFGFGRNTYLEFSFTNRIFNHLSHQRTGIFGKPLKNDPAVIPKYNFSFNGTERFLDLAYLKRFLVYRNNLNDLYFSAGLFTNYYLGSHVNDYEITIQQVNRTDTVNSKNYHAKNDRIDTSNINMDLNRLYKQRLNGGIFVSYGSITKLGKGFELFAELRFTLSKNFSYQFVEFNNYKVGSDYLAIIIGLTKSHNKIRVNKNIEPY